MGYGLFPGSVLLAFCVPLCIFPVYDLEPSSLGFFFFFFLMLYNIFAFYLSKKKKSLAYMFICMILN